MMNMRLLTTFILLVFFEFCWSQDTVKITNSNYISYFSKSKKYPHVVDWWITKNKVTCKKPIPRKNIFRPDPQIPELSDLESSYKKSGFDRGHMSPAADNQCLTEIIMNESFFYSNISPQYHSLNAGDWKKLEVWSRELSKKFDSIHIWSGNIGEIKKIGQVSVPEICWKVVLIKKTNETKYYLFKNEKKKSTGFSSHEVTKESFEKVVKFDFR